MRSRVWVAVISLQAATLLGCQASARRSAYETFPAARARNALLAQQLNEQGLEQIEEGNYPAAEAAFRRALSEDLYYAAAHNNLGLALLRRAQAAGAGGQGGDAGAGGAGSVIYEAAWEFQYAAKLMPHSPEPRNNLGLVYEHVGRLDQAVEYYEQALQIDPENIEVMGHLARVYVKANKKDTKLRDLLRELAFRGSEGGWDVWARQQLIRLGE